LTQEIKNIPKLNGIRVFQTTWIRSGSGICLPVIGIFIHSKIPERTKKRIIQHEYGHFLDYKFGLDGDRKKLLGSALLGFYFLIGIPSLFNLIPVINQIPAFAGRHQFYWTELRANRLAKAHFGDLIAEDFDRYFPTPLA
jgi:hypothetical protein